MIPVDAQAVIDAAIGVCLAERKLVELSMNYSQMQQASMANQMSGDWISQFAAANTTTDRIELKAIAENDVKKARLTMFRAVRSYQDTMKGRV